MAIIAGWPLILAACVTVSACGSLPAPTFYDERISRPDVGAEAVAEIGNPIFQLSRIRTYDGLEIPKAQRYQINPGDTVVFDAPLIRRGNDYCGTINIVSMFFGDVQNEPRNSCFTEASLTELGIPFTKKRVSMNEPDNFSQQLLYQGKNGNSVQMSYREFVGDLARPSFSQDLTFDLAAGKVIGTKGLRAEIISADNTSIRYRIIKAFD